LYLMVETFRRYFDNSGRLWIALNRNSYGVYIIHVIVIGVFGTLLLSVSLPAVVKYLLLVVSTYLASNVILSLYRQAAAGRKAISRPAVLSSPSGD
jgi:peptidoglycan/LPS O-acetylase OafA/YrhL